MFRNIMYNFNNNNMDIINTYNSLLKNGQINVRCPKTYSFGAFEECRKHLYEAMQLVDKSAKIIWLNEYEEVAKWMSDTKGKGLLLTGNLGRGKTTILEALNLLFRAKFNLVVTVHSSSSIRPTPELLKKWCYAVDEIGCEPMLNDYGTKYYPFMEFVNNAERYLKLVLVTTNLTSTELRNKYDDRTVDRLTRLCYVVKFNGKSLRK